VPGALDVGSLADDLHNIMGGEPDRFIYHQDARNGILEIKIVVSHLAIPHK